MLIGRADIQGIALDAASPLVPLDLITAKNEPLLHARLAAAADTACRPPADIVVSIVRGFLDCASDDN